MGTLVDLARVKRRLGIPQNECKYDRTLVEVVGSAADVLADALGEPLQVAVRSYYFRGDGGRIRNLPYHRINSVESLWVTGDVGEEPTPIDPASYDLTRYSGGCVLRSSDRWRCGYDYRADLLLGYEVLPEPLAEAIVVQVQEMVANSDIPEIGRGRSGVASQVEVVRNTAPDVDGRYAVGRVTTRRISPAVSELIRPYKGIRYFGL